jgi:hypothetical protein
MEIWNATIIVMHICKEIGIEHRSSKHEERIIFYENGRRENCNMHYSLTDVRIM